MQLRVRFCILVLMAALVAGSAAAREPGFWPEQAAWDATDIVAARVLNLRGDFQVEETWKGQVRPGDVIPLPQMAHFLRTNNLAAHGGTQIRWRTAVVVLFLVRSSSSTDTFAPVVSDGMHRSFAWLQDGVTFSYGYYQTIPGPYGLMRGDSTDSELRQVVSRSVAMQQHLNEIRKVAVAPVRAALLAQELRSVDWLYGADDEIKSELVNCGPAAVPALRQLLQDDSLWKLQDEVIELLSKAGGAAVGPELLTMLESDVRFWTAKGPALPREWWNLPEPDGSDSPGARLRQQYMRTFRLLEGLERIKYAPARAAVAQLRDVWRSLPQLDDKSGLDEMSRECDRFLAEVRE